MGTGVRHRIASKQEAEHILKLGMLPLSWANLLLPSSGHKEAAYARAAQAVLLCTSSQYQNSNLENLVPILISTAAISLTEQQILAPVMQH